MLAKSYTLKIFTSRPQFDAQLSAFTKLIEDAGKAGVHDDDALRGPDDQRPGDRAAHRQGPDDASSTTRRPSRSCPRRSRPSGASRSARPPARPSTSSTCRPSARSAWSRRPRRVACQVFVETRILYVHLTRGAVRAARRQHLHRHAAAAEEERQGCALEGDGEGLDPRARHRSRRATRGPTRWTRPSTSSTTGRRATTCR